MGMRGIPATFRQRRRVRSRCSSTYVYLRAWGPVIRNSWHMVRCISPVACTEVVDMHAWCRHEALDKAVSRVLISYTPLFACGAHSDGACCRGEEEGARWSRGAHRSYVGREGSEGVHRSCSGSAHTYTQQGGSGAAQRCCSGGRGWYIGQEGTGVHRSCCGQRCSGGHCQGREAPGITLAARQGDRVVRRRQRGA